MKKFKPPLSLSADSYWWPAHRVSIHPHILVKYGSIQQCKSHRWRGKKTSLESGFENAKHWETESGCCSVSWHWILLWVRTTTYSLVTWSISWDVNIMAEAPLLNTMQKHDMMLKSQLKVSSSNWKWPHCGSMGRTQTIQTDISLITLITHTHTWLLNTHTYHTQIFRYFITFLCAVQELNLYLLNIQNGMQMQQLCFLVFQSKVCLWTMCTAGSGPGWPAVSELSYISQRTQRFPGVSCYSRTGCTLL